MFCELCLSPARSFVAPADWPLFIDRLTVTGERARHTYAYVFRIRIRFERDRGARREASERASGLSPSTGHVLQTTSERDETRRDETGHCRLSLIIR